MDLEKVLAELRKERDAIDAAILSLERLDRRNTPGTVHVSHLAVGKPKNGINGVYRNPGPGESS
jgi:hypothetical protein